MQKNQYMTPIKINKYINAICRNSYSAEIESAEIPILITD